ASADEPDNFASFGVGGLTPGSKVFIQKSGQWLPGSVVRQSTPGSYLVHYEGYGAEWDESVGLDKIRPAQDPAGAAGARDYRPGEKGLVEARGRLLWADVLQQVARNSWRVHYDGYGPEIAENVGPERISRPYVGTSSHVAGETVMVELGGRSMA